MSVKAIIITSTCQGKTHFVNSLSNNRIPTYRGVKIYDADRMRVKGKRKYQEFLKKSQGILLTNIKQLLDNQQADLPHHFVLIPKDQLIANIQSRKQTLPINHKYRQPNLIHKEYNQLHDYIKEHGITAYSSIEEAVNAIIKTT
jgi:hypothetical protein